MPATEHPSDRTTLVVGASRGLGRGVAVALATAGDPVVAVARTEAALAELRSTAGIQTEVADARDPTVPARMIERHRPQAVIVVAGANPPMLPLQHQSWESFSVNWRSDVRIAFEWSREALIRPLRPGSRVIVVSSGAALNGSPLSGGYAGAKATQRFIARYAQEESDRGGLGIRFTSVFPRITPYTDLGRPAIAAYAARNGQTEEDYLRPFGAALTPEVAGAAVLELVRTADADLAAEYLITGDGLRPLPS